MIKIDREAIKDYDDFNRERYKERKDKDNICPIGLTDADFINIIGRIFLGKEWYISMPLSKEQVNEEILEEIIYRITKQTVQERDNERIRHNKRTTRL